jgi:hypothetical protein
MDTREVLKVLKKRLQMTVGTVIGGGRTSNYIYIKYFLDTQQLIFVESIVFCQVSKVENFRFLLF